MHFSDVADILLQHGYSPHFIQDVRVDFLKTYPAIEAASFQNAVSTVQPDPLVPAEWVETLFAELGIPFRVPEGLK